MIGFRGAVELWEEEDDDEKIEDDDDWKVLDVVP